MSAGYKVPGGWLMDKKYTNRMEMPEWVRFFLEFIVSDDLNEETTESFLLHLADLGPLVLIDENMWQWKGCDTTVSSNNLVSSVKNDLESLSDTESGFALAYFIGFKELNRKPFFTDKDSSNPKNDHQRKKDSGDKPASDLSNLQIVKKVGKQLQPFLQVEESVVSRFVGKHVDKQKAQKLFHYMFSKVGAKAEPRAWEQLSRKRHR